MIMQLSRHHPNALAVTQGRGAMLSLYDNTWPQLSSWTRDSCLTSPVSIEMPTAEFTFCPCESCDIHRTRPPAAAMQFL